MLPRLLLPALLLAGGLAPGATSAVVPSAVQAPEAAAAAPRPALLATAAPPQGPQAAERADSVGLLREARAAQNRFERTRVFHAPHSWWSGGGECDEIVGRFCLRFGSDDPDEDRPSWTPPPEAAEVVEAREELLQVLGRVAEALPGDRWTAGQRVAYLAEAGRWEEALVAAEACRAEGWWCEGLRGLALHGLARTPEAEAAFAAVLDLLPDRAREDWDDPSLLAEPDLRRTLTRADGEEGRRSRARAWILADPLYLLPGNEVRTEHLARWVLSETRRDARNGHGLGWGDDLTELLVRFGPVVAYERVDGPLLNLGPQPVVGRYDPEARHLFPSEAAVADPAASTPEDWRTDRRHARSRHAPPASPRIAALEVQVARFRRGDDLLLAAAWAPRRPPDETGGELQAGLFLLEEGALDEVALEEPAPHPVRLDESAAGTGLARVPSGAYLASIEVLDPEARRGWRERRGVGFSPEPPGVVQLSDLLLLEPSGDGGGAEHPAAAEDPAAAEKPAAAPGRSPARSDVPPLDSLLPRAHRGTRLPAAPVEVVWEIYGLGPGDGGLELELEAAPAGQGALRRLGERIGLLSRPPSVALRWEEGVGPEARSGDPYARRVVLDLSGLEEGSYELRLGVTAPGRTTARAVRAIEVTLDR